MEVVKDEDAVEKKTEIATVAETDQYDRSQLPNFLRVYYTWIFPYDKYFEWLQYGERSSRYCESHDCSSF